MDETLQRGRRSMAAVMTLCWNRTVAILEIASTGPPLDGGGDKRVRLFQYRARRDASTGPPLDGGGDSTDGVCTNETRRSSFNGAAARWRR